MKKGLKIAAGIIVVGALAALVVARIMKPAPEMQTKELPAVNITNPFSGDIAEETSLMGTVHPSDTYYVMPKASGELLEIYVTNGQFVKKGDPIAKIDNQKQIDAAKASLDAARASADAAQAQANSSQDALNRMTPLYQAGDISAQSYNQTANTAAATANQAKAARAQVETAQLSYETQMENAIVTAPADGTVQNEDMSLNTMVSPQSQLCVITGSGQKVINFNVIEEVMNNMKLGDPVVVEKNGSEYQGSVSKIGEVVNQQTGLFPVEANLVNADALSDGSTAKLRVTAKKANNTMLLPLDCIYYSGGNPYVYTYKDGQVKRVFVTTGINDKKNIQILDGITPQDDIVSSWTDEIYDGASVRLSSEVMKNAENASAGAAKPEDAAEHAAETTKAAEQETTAVAETTK